jgi:RNA recognition motif-containing protein
MIGDNVTTTLFLGDLSIYCQEKEVFALFRPYGPIESIQIKRSDETMTRKPHLSYGFVKFEFRESAERALMELNGKIFLGRAIRLGWASNNLSDRNYQPYHIKKDPTAQIHITFLCPLDMYPITEEKLRLIFERFGEIVDVTINRVECNQVSSNLILLQEKDH